MKSGSHAYLWDLVAVLEGKGNEREGMVLCSHRMTLIEQTWSASPLLKHTEWAETMGDLILKSGITKAELSGTISSHGLQSRFHLVHLRSVCSFFAAISYCWFIFSFPSVTISRSLLQILYQARYSIHVQLIVMS